MNQRLKELFVEAQRLDPVEREQLAELLLATLDVDPQQDAQGGRTGRPLRTASKTLPETAET